MPTFPTLTTLNVNETRMDGRNYYLAHTRLWKIGWRGSVSNQCKSIQAALGKMGITSALTAPCERSPQRWMVMGKLMSIIKNDYAGEVDMGLVGKIAKSKLIN
mgnify:CR=1 FL=1